MTTRVREITRTSRWRTSRWASYIVDCDRCAYRSQAHDTRTSAVADQWAHRCTPPAGPDLVAREPEWEPA